MIKAVIFDFFGVMELDGRPNQDLLNYIRTYLKPKYKIGIISNAAGDWVNRVLSVDDVKLFDDITISYKVGHTKPSPEIYKLSLNNLGVNPEEAIFIDDIQDYCVAASNLGMRAIFYKNFEQLKLDLASLLSNSPAVSKN